MLKDKEKLEQALEEEQKAKTTLEEQKATLEQVMGNMKEQHKEYIHNFEEEMEKSLQYMKESLTSQHGQELNDCKWRESFRFDFFLL